MMRYTVNYNGKPVQGSVPTSECRHPNAKPTGHTCSSECCSEYQCPDCGKRFMFEWPE